MTRTRLDPKTVLTARPEVTYGSVWDRILPWRRRRLRREAEDRLIRDYIERRPPLITGTLTASRLVAGSLTATTFAPGALGAPDLEHSSPTDRDTSPAP